MARSCTTIIPVRWLRPRTWQLAFSAVLAIAGGIDSGVGHSHAARKVTASVAIDANGETELTRRLMRSDKPTQHSHSRGKQSNLQGSKADGETNFRSIAGSIEKERLELSTLMNETKSLWHHEKQLEAVEKDRAKNIEELTHVDDRAFKQAENQAMLEMPDDAPWRVKVRRLASRKEDDDASSASSDPKEFEPAASRSSEDKELEPAASGPSEDMDEDASDSDPSQDESHAALEAERPTSSRKPQVDRTVRNEINGAFMDTMEAHRLFDEMSAEAKFIGSHVGKFGKFLTESEAKMDDRA